ncbi:hypothetical protein GLOIN_2v1709640 [Rhizophagus irregularis DAOM 181602=DAOM 197198]|nr:hypothetical protein GLOIN_2v1709640 [Rhizophagus irregularis DAOM 181602=DAOM 197198]
MMKCTLASKIVDHESDKWAGIENQKSENLSTTNDYDNLGNLIYYDNDGGGGSGKKSKITKPCKPFFINHRNIAYNILKYLDNDMVENKEIPELEQCSELCIEKQLLYIKLSTCPFPDCEKNIDIIVDPNSIRRGSQSSQSSRTLVLTNLMGKKVVLSSPIIPEEGRRSDPIDTTGVAKETSNQATNPDNSENVDDSELSSRQIQRFICEKCFEEISIEFMKDTIFLSCKHAMHYNCIDDPCKKCSICSAEDLELFPVELTLNTAQKKCTWESTAEKSSSKKKKISHKDDVSTILKKLIKELLTNTPNTGKVLEKTNVPDALSNTGALS